MNSTGSDRGDAELVKASVAGDRSAFTALYRRHRAGVGRALASYAGPDRSAIDDLTQEVFLRVVENLERYVPRRPFTHWLYTIALNVGRNHARRSRGVVPLDTAEATGSGLPVREELLRGAAMRGVTRLPEAMRDVVALRIGSELTFGEIAAVLDIPEGTARRRMHQALQALREQLGLGERKDRA